MAIYPTCFLYFGAIILDTKKTAIVDETPAFVKALYTSQATTGPTIPIDTMFAPKVVNPP